MTEKKFNKGHANLIPLNRRTPEEVKRIASNGGKKSQANKREEINFKKKIQAMLEVDGVFEGICGAIIEQANNGSTKAFELLRDTLDQKPVEKKEETHNINLFLDKAAEKAVNLGIKLGSKESD